MAYKLCYCFILFLFGAALHTKRFGCRVDLSLDIALVLLSQDVEIAEFDCVWTTSGEVNPTTRWTLALLFRKVNYNGFQSRQRPSHHIGPLVLGTQSVSFEPVVTHTSNKYSVNDLPWQKKLLL